MHTAVSYQYCPSKQASMVFNDLTAGTSLKIKDFTHAAHCWECAQPIKYSTQITADRLQKNRPEVILRSQPAAILQTVRTQIDLCLLKLGPHHEDVLTMPFTPPASKQKTTMCFSHLNKTRSKYINRLSLQAAEAVKDSL